jgi:hypothetical protein
LDLRDFIVTPFVILGVYAIAFFLRPRLTNEDNRGYFFPSLTVKIVGALVVGLLYQFFYEGGDTYNYHTHGSRVIWDAFMDNPGDGLSLIVRSYDLSLYKYTSKIPFYTDPGSFFVVRVAAIFDLLTFSTYSATAVLFAFLSFLGTWFLFRTFYELYPHLKTRFAWCTLFVPSVVVWGSGLLKDTLVLGALGLATYTIKRLFIDRKVSITYILVMALSLFMIFEVKKYVLLCFLPSAIFWVYGGNLLKIRSVVLRAMLLPFVIAITVPTATWVLVKVSENDQKYAITKLAETARVTAYDIGFYSGRGAGSSYSLGELDGSVGSMITLFPQAVNVSLFRPYLWEARNPLMLISAVESFLILVISLLLLLRRPASFFRSLWNPTIIFCLMFSITFAFGVGVSTYNFGTLSRYRIPLIPFYLIALVLIAEGSKRERNVAVLESTE